MANCSPGQNTLNLLTTEYGPYTAFADAAGPVADVANAAGNAGAEREVCSDVMFQAVCARLAHLVEHGVAPQTRAGVLECVAALGQLHEHVIDERARHHQCEQELAIARSALASARVDIVSSRVNERRSRRLALQDQLTTLPNRSFFSEWLDHALAQAASLDHAMAVIYLDLDGFKSINDAHGHDVGDELLRIVAVRLARAVRAEDVVSRLGGDEFACLLTDLPGREPLAGLACKLVAAVAAPVKIGALELAVRPSIGIALSPADGASADVLLRNADAAMYQAKRQRSGYAFYDDRSGAHRAVGTSPHNGARA